MVVQMEVAHETVGHAEDRDGWEEGNLFLILISVGEIDHLLEEG